MPTLIVAKLPVIGAILDSFALMCAECRSEPDMLNNYGNLYLILSNRSAHTKGRSVEELIA